MNSMALHPRTDDTTSLLCMVAGAPRRLEGTTLHLQSVDGRAWITKEGDRDDYVIEPGDVLEVIGEGVVVIESLTPFACVRLTVH